MRELTSARPARGLLTPASSSHQRILPCAELAPYVAHFWWVSWALSSTAAPRRTATLPHPTVHLTFETRAGRSRTLATIHGVATRRFTRILRGRGRVFGIKLRPAALHAFTRTPASRFTDRRMPISAVFGRDGTALARALRDTANATDATPLTPAHAIALAEPFLLAHATPLPAHVAELRDLVERIEHDRTIRRAADAARLLGCTARTLQRLFQTHVGVGAKSVIQRYRLMEAVEQLKLTPTRATLAALAADLGYADQAHFSRDFSAVIGLAPRAYATATATATASSTAAATVRRR